MRLLLALWQFVLGVFRKPRALPPTSGEITVKPEDVAAVAKIFEPVIEDPTPVTQPIVIAPSEALTPRLRRASSMPPKTKETPVSGLLPPLPVKWPIKLDVTPLGFDEVKGIYTIRGQANRMPDRARWLHPLAAESVRKDLAEVITFSDILRTGESSLAAVKAKRGAQPPAYSGHNYGFSIDIEVDLAMKALKFKIKAELDAWMQSKGWYCHRKDGQRGHEDWHYNYLALFTALTGKPFALSPQATTTAGDLEGLIQKIYGPLLVPDGKTCQMLLKKLGLYHGEIDGELGPLSTEAIKGFQRAWMLAQSGKLDARTTRTLAFIAADRPTS